MLAGREKNGSGRRRFARLLSIILMKFAGMLPLWLDIKTLLILEKEGRFPSLITKIYQADKL